MKSVRDRERSLKRIGTAHLIPFFLLLVSHCDAITQDGTNRVPLMWMETGVVINKGFIDRLKAGTISSHEVFF